MQASAGLISSFVLFLPSMWNSRWYFRSVTLSAPLLPDRVFNGLVCKQEQLEQPPFTGEETQAQGGTGVSHLEFQGPRLEGDVVMCVSLELGCAD